MQKPLAASCFLVLLAAGGCAPAHSGPRSMAVIADTVASGVPNEPGFPALAAKNLGIKLQDLTKVRTLPNFTAAMALEKQVPAVAADTTDALVALGPTDLDSMARGFEQLAAVEDADLAIINALLERHINVYEVTIRDFTLDHRWTPGTIPHGRAQRIPGWTRQLNRFIIATPGITVLDLTTHDELEKPEYYEPDGIHLSPLGESAYAKAISDLIAHSPAWKQKNG